MKNLETLIDDGMLYFVFTCLMIIVSPFLLIGFTVGIIVKLCKQIKSKGMKWFRPDN